MKSMDKFIKTIAKLRGTNGCPWDKEQTHKTLKRYLIEEAYEAIEAIDRNNPKAIMEELGDVLLQVVLHAQIASENKHFSLKDIVNCINKKMITRHPHVFSNVKVKNTEEVLVNWEKLKNKEDGIPKSLPALMKAFKVSKNVSKANWVIVEKKLIEFKDSAKSKNKSRQLKKLGDLLFTIVCMARLHRLDPEESLNNSIKRVVKSI